MKFSRFLLENYLATEEGTKSLTFFRELPSLLREGRGSTEIKYFIDSLLLVPYADTFYEFPLRFDENFSFENLKDDALLYEQDLSSEEKQGFHKLLGEIPFFSLELYAKSPELAFPYFYPLHFFRVQQICDFFEIPLPPLPGKRQHCEKFFYYVLLCNALHEFRALHGMSPEELCVFFYSFARHFFEKLNYKQLPKPFKVYISGASQGDLAYIDSATFDSLTCWQGNLDTEPGDIVLVYELAPRSRIGSVWRAISPGYADPFRYYYETIWVGYPQKIPPITLDELKTDPVWSKKGLVRANMQGVSGRACSREEYLALLAMLKRKNFDINSLPPAPEEIFHALSDEIADERDVEIRLLEPFLKRLGFKEQDWQRQMPLRMGRGVRYYPDYVIHPKAKRGEESCFFVWEAKYRIPNLRQLQEDFYQTKSYAIRLESRGLGLVACEGVWISFATDKFDFKKVQFYSWPELTNSDTFNSVRVLLKKEKDA